MSTAQGEDGKLPNCTDAFRRLMWGMLFFVPIRLQLGGVFIEVPPDFLGWMLVLSAVPWLIRLYPARSKGLGLLACIGLALSLPQVVVPTQAADWQQAVAVLSGAALVMQCLMVWRLCGLATGFAAGKASLQLACRAQWARWLYWVRVPIFVYMQLARGPQGPLGGIALAFWLARGLGLLLVPCIAIAFAMSVMSLAARLCETAGPAESEPGGTSSAEREPRPH